MDTTILNNTNVYAVNCNEIFNYSPKRKIEIINDNNKLSAYDKNFTFLVSFHPISPYSLDQTDAYHLNPNDIKCTSETFIDLNDYHYLNNDSFDLWNDSTESMYPILNYDSTCNYDNSSLVNGDLFNCFSVFIYKKKLHWVINDSTSSPALVHCEIDLDDIELQHHKYYHVILTRNDNIYTMHLILDKYSLFSTYDPELIYRLPESRHNTEIDIMSNDITTIESDIVDNIANVNLDEEFNIEFTYENDQRYIEFTISEISDIVIELLPDERHKHMSCLVDEHYSPTNSTSYGGVGLDYHNLISLLNPENLIDELDNVISKNYETGRFSVFVNMQPGKYKFLLSYNFGFENYPDIAFLSYTEYINNTDYDSRYNKPSNVSFKIYKGQKYENLYFDWDHNYKTDTVIQTENINISEIINDNKLVLGYLERYPSNILNNNLLFKNSFKGYITESSFYRDQVYLRKFNNTIPFNSFQYITDYTAAYNDDLNQYNLIRPDFENIENDPETSTPFSSQNNMKSVIVNENKVPLKSYFNLLENNNNFSEYPVSWQRLDTSNEGNTVMPRLEYFTNFIIDDIILIDDDIVDTNIINNVSNKITHSEYEKSIDSSSSIEYTGNNIIINNKTFCIFTFDIMKDIKSSDGYTVYDQKKFLMTNVYVLEEYNENKTYQLYLDGTTDYIQPIDLNVNSLKKFAILNSLNSYIDTIKNSPNNLFVIKFIVQCFRDSRYMFIYKISNKTISIDRVNLLNYHLVGKSITSSNLFNTAFDNITEPYHVNFDYRMATTTAIPGHYFTRKPERWKGFNGNHYVYNGFYYSDEELEGEKTITLLYSNDLYREDFDPIPLDKVLKVTEPSYLSTQLNDIYLENLNYDLIHITDLNKTIFIKMKVSDYINKYGNLLSMYIESELLEDGTVITEFTFDPNKHYYIELYDSTNNDNIVAGDFWHVQGSSVTRIPNYTITELDSTTYKIDYTNVNTNDIALYIDLDFSDNISEKDKLKLALSLFEHGHNFEMENGYCHTLPTIKYTSKKDIFQVEYEKLFDDHLALYLLMPVLQHSIYGRYTTDYNSYIHNLINYNNYEIGTSSMGEYDNNYNEYVAVSWNDLSYMEYFHSKINITYDNDKRIIEDY